MERDEIVTLVARNIQASMAEKGISAAELARAANINPTGVYDILSGKSRSPRLDTIGKIAFALRMPVSRLFQNRTSDELIEQIVDVFSTLDESDQKRLLSTARAWIDAPTQS